MEKEKAAQYLQQYRARLAKITPPKTKAELYEADMLKADIKKLKRMLMGRECPACTKGEYPHRNCILR